MSPSKPSSSATPMWSGQKQRSRRRLCASSGTREKSCSRCSPTNNLALAQRSRFAPVAFALAEQNAVRTGDAKLEALGNATGALDEPLGRGRRANLARRLLEQRQPSIEVARIYSQGHMLHHRLAVIAPRVKRQRRPEGEHIVKMRIPVRNPRLEDRREQRILPHPRIEPANQRLDHRFVDARFFLRERHDSGAALFGAVKFVVHSRVPDRSPIAYMMAWGLARQFD